MRLALLQIAPLWPGPNIGGTHTTGESVQPPPPQPSRVIGKDAWLKGGRPRQAAEAGSRLVKGCPTMMIVRFLAHSATRYRIADMSQSRLCTMVLLLMIGGCAGSMGTIHSNPPPRRPSPRSTAHTAARFKSARLSSHPSLILGVRRRANRSSRWRTGSSPTRCRTPTSPSVWTLTFPATIAQDGSFYGEITIGTISGRVDGTHMEGKIDGSACVYDFTGDRI